MYFDLANVLVFSLVAVGFVAANLMASKLLLRPKSTQEASKLAIYECGEPTIGQAWIRFDIRFYTVALMFVVFDVEVALLFPWGAVFRDLVDEGLGWLAFAEVGVFLVILMAGLAYVWARGDLEWSPTQKSVPLPETPIAAIEREQAAGQREQPVVRKVAAGAGGVRA